MNQVDVNFRDKLEAMIVSTLQSKLDHKEIAAERAKEIAQKVLQLIPEGLME